MNILGKYTIKALIKNKTRTVVTIIGIILSTAMITAVTVSIMSLICYLREVAIHNDGNWHGYFESMSGEEAKGLLEDTRVESSAFAQEVGYAPYENINEGKPYVFVLGGDSLFMERMPLHLTAGRLPETSSEIILPEHLFDYDGRRPELGETISLELGCRELNGERLSQHSKLDSEESLIWQETRNYTLVGVYKRPSFEEYSAPGYTAVTGWNEGLKVPVDAWFMMENIKDTLDFVKESGYSWEMNTDLLMFYGVVGYRTFFLMLYGLGAILIGLIVFGSVSLIYNAFSISVSDRTKQFGLLSSVGATKRQIKQMVFIEAAAVSAVGIPLGILSGIGGMAVTFHFIGHRITTSIIGVGIGINDSDMSLRLNVSWQVVVLALVIALVTVLVSAWIPSRRATKVTAIEAIRQSQDVVVKDREVKTSRLTWKLFGLEGAIASKHFKRSKKGYRATVVSLFMSVVLFISASSFCSYLTDSVTSVFERYDYDIAASWDAQGEAIYPNINDIMAKLGTADGVTKMSGIRSVYGMMTIPWDALTEEARAVAINDDGSDIEKTGWQVYTGVFGVDDKTFRDYLLTQGFNEADFFDEESPRLLLTPSMYYFNDEEGRLTTTKLILSNMESVSISLHNDKLYEEFVKDMKEGVFKTQEKYDEAYNATLETVQMGSVILAEELPFGLNTSTRTNLAAVYPMSVFDTLFTDSYIDERICFKTTNHETATDTLRQVAQEAGLKVNFNDVYAAKETEMDLVVIIKVFSYGFITLISLIALANVFNTISTNIYLRRREFAMLRSVGETNNGFNRMMSYECILYGIRSLMYGIPVAFCLTYLIYRTVRRGMDTGFYLPWTAVVIAVGSVFLVVFGAMMYSTRKIKRDNPIDALTNENW